MRPSRIVVGEVRQEECLDLTQYASTHTGPYGPDARRRGLSQPHMRFRLASSRSVNTSRCRGPAPISRWRGRSTSHASWRPCQRGPSSATSSASTSRDNPVTRRSATAAARASVLNTLRPCSARHEQDVPLTMHEVVNPPRRRPAAGQSFTTGRDATAGDPAPALPSPAGEGRLHRRGPVGTPVRVPRRAARPPVTSGREGSPWTGAGGPAAPSLISGQLYGVTHFPVSHSVTGPVATRILTMVVVVVERYAPVRSGPARSGPGARRVSPLVPQAFLVVGPAAVRIRRGSA